MTAGHDATGASASTPISRRSILAAAALPIAVTPATTPHPDAALLAAYAEFRAVDFAYNLDPARSRRSEDECDALFDRWSALRDRIMEARASTPAGVAVLAMMALRESAPVSDSLPAIENWSSRPWGAYGKPDGIDDDPVLRVLWSIAESVNGVGFGGGGQLAVLRAPIPNSQNTKSPVG